jgi:NitT/TauT family transport system ATP-binding protein
MTLAIDIHAKMFAAQHVLGEIGLDIPGGQRVGLLGPSGIGKSTLLALIAGTDGAFEGQIVRPEGRVAMIFQAPRLLPWRTLAENIALVPGAGDMARARSLLADVGLAKAADQYPEKASLGMQRRAALARALAVDPAVMLLDEPLVSLDPAAAEDMREVLRRAMDRTDATVIMATHNRREALGLCDRVIELDGPPATIRRDRMSPLDRDARHDIGAVDRVCQDWFGHAA